MRKAAAAIVIFCSVSVSAFAQLKTLDSYINDGLAASPLLKDLSNQYSSTVFDSALIRAAKKPQVDARSVLQYIPVYGKFGYDDVVTDNGSYQGLVGVSQDIFRKREVNNRLEALGIRRSSLVNSKKITVNELRKIITDQYLTAFSVFSDLTFNTSFLALLNSENDLVRQLAAKGIYRQTDYLSLLLETQTQEILVKKLESDFRGSLRQLNIVCGINDTASYTLELPSIQVSGATDITNSPAFLQYRVDSLRISNDRYAIDIRYRPKLSWFADAGFLSHDLTSFYTHFGYSAGLSFSIPIYDGNQRSIEKQKLEAEENTRSNYRDNFTVRYRQQVLQLNSELVSEKQILESLEKQLKTSESLIRGLKTELEAGLVQMTDYLSAVKNYRFINKALSDSRIRIQQVVSEINYTVNQ
jgi:outer membrane protein TolC